MSQEIISRCTCSENYFGIKSRARWIKGLLYSEKLAEPKRQLSIEFLIRGKKRMQEAEWSEVANEQEVAIAWKESKA